MHFVGDSWSFRPVFVVNRLIVDAATGAKLSDRRRHRAPVQVGHAKQRRRGGILRPHTPACGQREDIPSQRDGDILRAAPLAAPGTASLRTCAAITIAHRSLRPRPAMRLLSLSDAVWSRTRLPIPSPCNEEDTVPRKIRAHIHPHAPLYM